MNTFKKNILTAALLVAAALPVSGQGFTAYSPTTLVNGGTNVVLAGASNVYSASIFNVTRQREVAVVGAFKAQGTDSSTITIHVIPSVDGTTFDASNHTYDFSVAANGTSTVTFSTNITAGAFGYLEFAAFNPNATQPLTNVVLKASLKR